ncbi:hypothetical protein BDZ94DRAFT_1140590, partial [Collybia nuda]
PIDPVNYPLPGNDHDPDLDPEEPELRRSSRPTKPPGSWWVVPRDSPAIPENSDEEANFTFGDIDEDGYQDIHFAGAATGPDPDPRTWKLAMKSGNADKWQAAADVEIDTLVNNQTWDVVDLPQGKKPIGSGW